MDEYEIERVFTRDDISDIAHGMMLFRDGNKTPRDDQINAALFAVNSPMSVVVIRGDCGTGKSCIGAIICEALDNAVYLVNTKSLQEQIKRDFPEARVLFGRSNYPCIFDPCDKDGKWTRSAAECPLPKVKSKGDEDGGPRDGICPIRERCPYRVEKEFAKASSFAVLNYPYYLCETNYAYNSSFAGRNVVVCDEADTLGDTLLDFIGITLSERQMRKYKLGTPKFKTAGAKEGVSSWRKWADESVKKIRARADRYGDPVTQKDIEEADGLRYKLRNFLEYVDDTWIYDEGATRYGKTWSFKPTWVTPEMTDAHFRDTGGKFVLMSATLPPLPALSLQTGIPVDEMDYYEMESVFKAENRPIKFLDIASLSNSSIDENADKIRDAVKDILAKHPTEKGLIHTSSYKLAGIIMSIGDGRLITHDSRNRQEVLDKFKESDQPLVLVSPSMERGVSLNDDLARFLILAKAPFPNLSDKQTSVRLYSSRAGKYWYNAMTAQTMEQQAGRGTRSESDWCTVYILDEHAKRLITSNPKMFTKHFRECIVW